MLVEDATGPIDEEGVASALAYLPGDAVQDALDGSDFLEGYSRVWEHPDDPRHFAVAIVLAFRGGDGAMDFLDFGVGALEDRRATRPIGIGGVDGAFGYGFGGARGRTGAPTFCHLVVFARSRRTYEVRVCAPTQEDPEPVRELARSQARLAAT